MQFGNPLFESDGEVVGTMCMGQDDAAENISCNYGADD